MQISKEEYKNAIRQEYINSYVHYQAMKLLAKQEGIDDDPEPSPEPTPQPTPESTPEPEPISKDPEIVYNGSTVIILSREEGEKFSVFVNNVESAADYIINTSGEPTYYRCQEQGYKTTNGYRLDFNVTGVNVGIGIISVYLKKDKNNTDKWLKIKINVNR